MKRSYPWLGNALQPGPDHVATTALPNEPVVGASLSTIAHHLPQIHAIPANDVWRGQDLNECCESRHRLRRPVGLSYQDLRIQVVMRRRGELAKRGGLRGFCLPCYRFAGGEVQGAPFNSLLADPWIDISLRIDPANVHWLRRRHGGSQPAVAKTDYRAGDPRRLADFPPMLVMRRFAWNDGRPLLMACRPDHVSAPQRFFADIRCAIGDLRLGDPFPIVFEAFGRREPELDFDAAACFPPHGGGDALRTDIWRMRIFDVEARGLAIDCNASIGRIVRNDGDGEPLVPGVCPSWDKVSRQEVTRVNSYSASLGRYDRWSQLAVKKVPREQNGPDRFFLHQHVGRVGNGRQSQTGPASRRWLSGANRSGSGRVIAGTPKPNMAPTRAPATSRNAIVNRLRSTSDQARTQLRSPTRP